MKYKIKDGLHLPVNLIAQVWDAKTGELLDTIKTHNLVVMAGRNLIRDFLNGDVRTGLNYFALGTGTTAPAPPDAQLQTEVFRDVFASLTKADGDLLIKYYLASGSANGSTLTEAALFGNGATATVNSGTLYARALLTTSIVKTSSIAVTFNWDCGITI